MGRLIAFVLVLGISLALSVGFWGLVIWVGANIVKGVFGS